MEYSPFAEQSSSDARALALADFRAQLTERRHDVIPTHISGSRAGKNQFERSFMLSSHELYSTYFQYHCESMVEMGDSWQ